jgi:hypothetical protein
MTEKWPAYEVANEAVVHALGVMNINYVWMLAATGNMTEDQAAVFVSRINPSERATIIDMFYRRRTWPNSAGDAIKHYVSAMRVLTENRNSLIHGNVITSFGNEPAIFSLNRNNGAMTVFQSSLSAIRQAADDAETYFQFGLALANYIATEIHGAARAEGMLVMSECPTIPPMPLKVRAIEA